MARWEPTTWDDPRIIEEDVFAKPEVLGTLIRLEWPTGDVIIGRITMKPIHQNERAQMVRLMSRPMGDAYANAYQAVVSVWSADESPKFSRFRQRLDPVGSYTGRKIIDMLEGP